MNSELENLLAQTEEQKSKFLSEIDSWPEQSLHTAPEGHWNALQIIDHIMMSERGVLGYMMKKTSSGWETIEATNEEHDRMSQALNERLQGREQYKIPAVLTEPVVIQSYEAICMNWSELRNKMNAFMQSLDEEFYHRQIFNQPAAGKLNLYQTLHFLMNHIHHHMYQLERLKAFHNA